MAIHSVALNVTEGMFTGLSRQNMLFHQCICELVDNAIAAKPPNQAFKIDLILNVCATDNSQVDVYLADSGVGMSFETLKAAIQIGESATTSSRLNEHGFGLKNALATLSAGVGHWKLWTRVSGSATVSSATGPFRQPMELDDDDSFPQSTPIPPDTSTLLWVRTKLSFLQGVQGRGAPAKDLHLLREWLVEHLGVTYRGFLAQDLNTLQTDGVITVSIGTDTVRVPPIEVPLGNAKTEYLKVEIAGNTEQLIYRYGTLDEVRRDTLVRGQRAKFYYQKNQPTQGIDIRLGKRVIATRQFEVIWKTDDGHSQLTRHNNYNDFVGEVVIPELPRGVLSTVNNKTDFNLEDSDWGKIFARLNEFRPPQKIREKSEAVLRAKWMAMLKATSSADVVTDETSVWPTGTRIDVYRKMPTGQIIIYELKVGSGTPQYLYQLKMYWDGLVLCNNETPSEAILLCEDFSTNLEQMANMMNQLPPLAGSKPYSFKIEKLRDKGLA